MKALTIAVAVIGALSFASAASACPFMGGKTAQGDGTDRTVEAPIIKPSSS